MISTVWETIKAFFIKKIAIWFVLSTVRKIVEANVNLRSGIGCPYMVLTAVNANIRPIGYFFFENARYDVLTDDNMFWITRGCTVVNQGQLLPDIDPLQFATEDFTGLLTFNRILELSALGQWSVAKQFAEDHYYGLLEDLSVLRTDLPDVLIGR